MAIPIRQLLSQTSYNGDGGTTVWDFSFAGGYLAQAHVKASKLVKATGVITQITLIPANFIGQYQVSISPAIPVGTELTVYRDTPKDVPLVNFADKAALTEAALDLNAKQAIFVAAESSDGLATAIDSVAQITAFTNAASESATAAATSASSAGTAATWAGNSAVDASNSSVAATASASASAASAASASASQGAAAASATAAAGSASSALTSSNAAVAAKDAAQINATNASISAGVAGGHANTTNMAVLSAQNAEAGALDAYDAVSTLAGQVSTNAAAAAASYDAFDDRYLGAKASDPTLDNDGAALINGAMYWNTTVPALKVRSAGAWVTVAAATAAVVTNTPSGNIAATTVQAALNELDVEKMGIGQTSYFHARATADQLAITPGGFVQVNFGTEVRDDLNEFSASAFTASVTGVYHFCVAIHSKDGPDGHTATHTRILALYVNGAEYQRISEGVGIGSQTVAGSALVPLTAGQVVTARVYLTETDGLTGAAHLTWFTGARVK